MSTGFHSLQVYLTKAQYNKLQRGVSFQLSSQQLHLPNDKSTHHVELHVDANLHRKHQHAVRNQKGLRFSPHEIKGGSLKSIFKSVKKVANKVAHGIEQVKKVIPQSVIKGVVDTAIMVGGTYLGNPAAAAKISQSVNQGISSVYAHDLTHPATHQLIGNAIANEAQKTADAYIASGGSLKSIGNAFKHFGEHINNTVVKPAINGIVHNDKTIVSLAGKTAIATVLPSFLQPAANYALQDGVNHMPSGKGLKGRERKERGGSFAAPHSGAMREHGGSFAAPQGGGMAEKMARLRAMKKGKK